MRSFNVNSSKPAMSNVLRPRLVCLAAVLAVALASTAQDGKPSVDPGKATAPAADARVQQSKGDKPGNVATTDRKKQIADESAELLNMALALKAEVDKTTKDTLSLNVIKRADQIEKLAKSVKEKMKQSSGG